MTSLSEVYEGQVGEYASLRRLYLGVGLFLLGALLVVCGIAVATTESSISALGLTDARQYGGVLGGLGVPAVFLGIFTVLPAGRRTRAAAIVGAGVALLGVALFAHAYPCQWSGSNCGEGLVNLTLPTSGVYFLGIMTTFWCLFVGVANFKSRNDPGGTVRLQVTRQGETEIIEVPRSQVTEVDGAKGAMGRMGGIGFMGNTPDGDVETQTNRRGDLATSAPDSPASEPTRRGSGRRDSTSQGPASRDSPGRDSSGRDSASRESSGGDSPASDGGASTQDIQPLRDRPGGASTASASSPAAGSPSDQSTQSAPSTGDTDAAGDRPKNAGDAYCGSCTHFQYVRTENGMQPYCGLHDDLMDDMDACEEWNPR
ncbi:DUF7139 domain-containing protein [Halorarum salinum]|uniref:Ribonuclease BN n=1 Tax=Halorarum salinum TaxID=2743089 RepID=A0A7D5Q7Y4_9EURY|nr:ribonuclease BN [Halobaculum salinum]QLG60557.1 ribonuclease BN [Halobaculum salinum]